MHEPSLIATPTTPKHPALAAQAAASAAPPLRPGRTGPRARSTDVVVQIAADGQYMDVSVWAAELAQATQSPLRLVGVLPHMPDTQDRRLVESWMSARHTANARLTAALLAVRRRYPAVHVTGQLCTEGAVLVAGTLEPQTDVVVLPTP